MEAAHSPRRLSSPASHLLGSDCAPYSLSQPLADPLAMGVNTFSAAVHIAPGKFEPSSFSVWG